MSPIHTTTKPQTTNHAEINKEPSLQKNLVMGVDPGLQGAISLYNPQTRVLEAIYDMPVSTKNKWAKNKVHPQGIAEVVNTWKHRVMFAAIENVHALPNQGVVAMFSFGEGYGVVQGVLAAFGIKATFIEPSVWKSTLGLNRDKEASRAMAAGLFEEDQGLFKRMKDDGRAEAALIAVFASRFLS